MEDKKYDKLETMHGVFHTTYNKMYTQRKPWIPADPRKILSFMPGSVLGYSVKAGDKVKKGDQLALFKAMKMDNKILAPMDGVVKALCVEPGTNIAKNVVILELE